MRDLHRGDRHVITAAPTTEPVDALRLESKLLTVRRARGHFEGLRPMQRLDFHRCPQHRLWVRELELTEDIGAVTGERLVWIDDDIDVQIPWRAAAPAMLTLATQA